MGVEFSLLPKFIKLVKAKQDIDLKMEKLRERDESSQTEDSNETSENRGEIETDEQMIETEHDEETIDWEWVVDEKQVEHDDQEHEEENKDESDNCTFFTTCD